jgi:menaquinol-cytochrome c reductase iron-sulfur subunit
MPGAFEGETVTRRRFMDLTANGAGIVAASAILLPSIGFAAGTTLFHRPPVIWNTIGRPDEFPNDNYVPRSITISEGIGAAGKGTAYVRAYNPAIDGPRDPNFHEPFIAISNRCMHLGCPVKWVEAAVRFICPCHGGVYGALGQVDGGPPVRPLDRFYTRVRNGFVQLGPRYSVNSAFKRFPSYRDPGENLDSPLGPYVYPGRLSTPKGG